MSGLECSEIFLSNCKKMIDFRIDPTSYIKKYINNEKILSKLNCKKIKDIIVSIQNFGAYSLCNFINFVEKGVPFLKAQNIKSNYIDWNNLYFIDNKSHKLLYKSHCHKNQILITMAGEYLGKAAVYNKNSVCSSNQAIAKITLKDNLSPYIISTFLNTKYGQYQINRLKTITGQPNLNMALIQEIQIPVFNKIFSYEIENILQKVNYILVKSKQVYKQAKQILIDELNIKIENDNNINIKSFNNSFANSGRLDAEYYLPKYEDLQKNICKYPKKGNICSIITLQDKNITPKDNRKYKYIELANIDNIGNVIDCTEDFGANLPTRARRIVHTGDVIISSIEGSLNKCAVITEEFDGAFCSTGFFVIKSGIFTAETLLVLFKSEVLQNLMKKGCSGTILTAISKEEFEKICIPILNDNIQQKITCYIKQSKLLYNQSKLLLEVAKKSVEIAIEQNEDSALKYLEEKSNEILNLNKEVI